jgi:hypothetical protein
MYEYIYEWDNACIKVFHGRCIAVGLLGRWVHFLIPQPASSALPISNEVRSIEVGWFFNHIMYVCVILYIMFYHYTIFKQYSMYGVWYMIFFLNHDLTMVVTIIYFIGHGTTSTGESLWHRPWGLRGGSFLHRRQGQARILQVRGSKLFFSAELIT